LWLLWLLIYCYCEVTMVTDIQPIALPHHIEHVRYLLGKKPLPWAEKDLNHVSIFNKEKFLANFQFRRVPGFRFPTRVVATFVVTVLALYQVSSMLLYHISYIR